MASRLVLVALMAASAAPMLAQGNNITEISRWVAVDRDSGQLVVSDGGRLYLRSFADASPQQIAVSTPARFIPLQLRGPHLAGVVGGGEGDPGFFTILSRDGTAVNRCWENPSHCLDWGANPALSANGSAVVLVSFDPHRRLTMLRSCRLPALDCVADELPGTPAGIHWALGFRDALVILDEGLTRVHDGQVQWRGNWPISAYGGPRVTDVTTSEVLVTEPFAGAVHVFSLDDGRHAFSWRADEDRGGFARAMGGKTWQDAVLARCTSRVDGESPLLPEEVIPAGYRAGWRAIAAGMALDGGTAAFLPGGDLLVIGGKGSSGHLECRAPRRVWVVHRPTGTVGASQELATLLENPSVGDSWGSVRLTRGPAGPWYLCSDRGCSELYVHRLTQ